MSWEHNIETMVDAYLEAGLWATTMPDDAHGSGYDNGPMDDWYDPQDCVNRDEVYAECERFASDNLDDLNDVDGSWAQHGHDFLLTRDGHGAGFWDRGYGPAGDRLSEAARGYGDSGFMPDGWREPTDAEREQITDSDPDERRDLLDGCLYTIDYDDGISIIMWRDEGFSAEGSRIYATTTEGTEQ